MRFSIDLKAAPNLLVLLFIRSFSRLNAGENQPANAAQSRQFAIHAHR